MQSRAFRYLKTLLSKTSKTLVLAVFVFVTVLSFSTTTFAQAKLTDADMMNKYGNFINLFTTSSSTGVRSGISSIKANASLADGSIDGLVMTLNLGIDTSTNTAKWHWDRARTGSSGEFLIKICDPSNKCWLESTGVAEKEGTTVVQGNTYGGYSLFKTKTNGDYADSTTASYTLFNKSPHVKYRFDSATNTISTLESLVLPKGSTLTASFWYCASGDGKDPAEDGTKAKSDYDSNSVPTQSVSTFGTLCGGDSYFLIGEPYRYTIPTDAAQLAQDQADAAVVAAQKATGTGSDEDGNLPTCDIGFFGKSNIVGCLAQGVYYIIYWPLAWVAGLFGSLFDFFIGYSVSDASYRYSFAVTGWKLVRDIANIMFIIIMVYTGFAAVFSFGGKGGATMKRVVPALIINALIINFSLFATRTVIDLSNITARVFYSRMVVCEGPCKDENNDGVQDNMKRSPLGGYSQLSEKIITAFNPQRMFNADVLNSKEAQSTAGDDRFENSTSVGKQQVTDQKKGYAQDSAEYAGYYALVSIIAGAIMLAIGVMFFKVTFMFLGRVIGLYMAMIFSPFAFLTMNGGGGFFKIKGYDWDTWVNDLTNYAALAPIFTFFLYIIFSFLNTDMIKEIGVQDAGGSFFGTVLGIVIPMLIIYKLVEQGGKLAEKYAGEFGKMAQDTLTKAVGFAGGAALGGGALLGSNTIGRFANKVTDSEKFKDWAARNGRVGKVALRSIDSIGKGSFDARKTKLGQAGAKEFGMNLNQKALGTFGLDTKSTEGGYKKVQEDKIKDAEAYKKLLVSKKSDEEMRSTLTPKQIKARTEYDEKADGELKRRWVREITKDPAIASDPSRYGDAAWAKYKKDGKTKAKYEKSKDSYQKILPPPAYITTSERNKARTNAYAENMEKKSGGAFANNTYYDKSGNVVYKKGDLAQSPYATEDLYATAIDGPDNSSPVAKKGEVVAQKNAYQAFKELGEGAAKGAATGALIGSVVPVVGTAIGAGVGGMLGMIRGGLNYSGTTNKKIGKAVRTEEKKKDKIIDDLLKEIKKDADAAEGDTPKEPETPPSTGGGTGPTTP